MSNLEKVSDLILLNFAWDCPDCNAIWGVCASCKADTDDAARALADAGLLAPDLPEPSRSMTPNGKVWYLSGPIGDIRRTGEDIVAFGLDCRSQPFRLVLTEAEAETIAHALLAAANYAEDAAP